MKMPEPWPLEDINEPYQLLDTVLAHIRSQPQEDRAAMTQWYIVGLSDSLGVGVVVGRGRLLDEAQQFGQAFLTALWNAGRSPRLRRRLLASVAAHVKELHDQIQMWQAEWRTEQPTTYRVWPSP